MGSLFEHKPREQRTAAAVVKAARAEQKLTAPELIKGQFK